MNWYITQNIIVCLWSRCAHVGLIWQAARQEYCGCTVKVWCSLCVNKCHIIQIGTRNHKFEHEMNGTKLESVQSVNDLAITIASNTKFSKQLKKKAARKGNILLGFINRNFSFKNKDMLHTTTLYQVNYTLSGIRSAVLVASPREGLRKTNCPAKVYEDDYVFA